MSRKDDLDLTGQGMSETPRTDQRLKLLRNGHSNCLPKWEDFAKDIERELNQAIKERDRAQSALRTLIALHEREVETGEAITGEEWEIAGYALEPKTNAD